MGGEGSRHGSFSSLATLDTVAPSSPGRHLPGGSSSCWEEIDAMAAEAPRVVLGGFGDPGKPSSPTSPTHDQ